MGALKGGRPDDMTSSMALAIEQALNELLLADGLPALPTDESDLTRDRRRLFCAIARGVVRHLAARQTAFAVNVHDGAGTILRHPALSSD